MAFLQASHVTLQIWIKPRKQSKHNKAHIKCIYVFMFMQPFQSLHRTFLSGFMPSSLSSVVFFFIQRKVQFLERETERERVRESARESQTLNAMFRRQMMIWCVVEKWQKALLLFVPFHLNKRKYWRRTTSEFAFKPNEQISFYI